MLWKGITAARCVGIRILKKGGKSFHVEDFHNRKIRASYNDDYNISYPFMPKIQKPLKVIVVSMAKHLHSYYPLISILLLQHEACREPAETLISFSLTSPEGRVEIGDCVTTGQE